MHIIYNIIGGDISEFQNKLKYQHSYTYSIAYFLGLYTLVMLHGLCFLQTKFDKL